MDSGNKTADDAAPDTDDGAAADTEEHARLPVGTGGDKPTESFRGIQSYPAA